MSEKASPSSAKASPPSEKAAPKPSEGAAGPKPRSFRLGMEDGLLVAGFSRLAWTSGAIFVALWLSALVAIAPRQVLLATGIAGGLFLAHAIAFAALRKALKLDWPRDRKLYVFSYVVSYVPPAAIVLVGRLWLMVFAPEAAAAVP